MASDRYQRVVFQPATYHGMQRGINQVIEAVRPTMGPLPRLVALERSDRGKAPELLDDGGTIARRIVQLPDRNADVGAMFMRHVLWSVRERVGDGTATTAVLFDAIFNRGVRYVVSGGSPMRMRRYLEDGAKLILDQLSSVAVYLDGEEQLVQMAESVCYDPELAKLLGEIFGIIGEYGQLDIRTGRGRHLERQYVEGMYWDGGIFSRKMITDQMERKADLHNAAILISDLELEDPRQVARVLDMVMKADSKTLLIIAQKISDGVIAVLLAASQEPEKLQVIAAKTPGVGATDQVAAMEDLAILVGGRPILRAASDSLNRVKLEDLGQARRAWADPHHFGIVGGKGDPRRLRTHIDGLRVAYAGATDVKLRKGLQKRIGKLLGGAATLWIGGATKPEIETRKELAERTADALRGAVREGVVPGGGVSLLACRLALQARLDQSAETDERAAYKILIEAMENPIRVIVENAGYAPSKVMAAVAWADSGHGFDARTGRIVDMAQAGIWDSIAVLKAAVHSAIVSAGLALTTDVLVHHKKPDQSVEP